METARGRYAVLMQPQGCLSEETPTLLRLTVQQSGADCLYADAAVETREGLHPIYKPAFSPDTLLSYNYVGSPLFVSEQLWKKIASAAKPGESFAEQQYALSMHALLCSEHVAQIPHVLFYGAEPPIPREHTAVTWGMSMLNRQGAVGQGQLHGSFAVRYDAHPAGRVSIIVRSNGEVDALRRTLEAFELRCSCLNHEFLVASGGVLSERELRYFELLQKYGAAKICHFIGETNDARIKNLAASQAGGAYLMFVEAGVEPDSADAVERLVSHAQHPRSGGVGGLLKLEDGTWAQSELRVDDKDCPVMRRCTNRLDLPAGSTETVPDACIRNVTLLGGEVFLLRADVFMESGGFDETFDCCFCEAALSLSLAQRQLFNVCTPYARFSRNGVRRASLSRRNGERCSDVFRALRVHGDPLCSRNCDYVEKREHMGSDHGTKDRTDG